MIKEGVPECPLFGGNNNALGPTTVSAVRISEVVASQRLPMHYKYWVFNP